MPLIETKGAASAQGFGEFAQQTAATYIEDVFSTWLYTGNGSTQTITNGVDLAGKGGLVWSKSRSPNPLNHFLCDTVRGRDYYLISDATVAQQGPSPAGRDISSFNSNGYSLGIGANADINNNGQNFVSWTFREQPKFFDVVTWTATGSTQTISHNLGSVPGTIIVKRTSGTSSWFVYHRSLGANAAVFLNNTNPADTGVPNYWNGTAPTSTQFTVGDFISVSGSTYVAYLFAHDAGGFGLTGADNVISCGSYTGTGAAGNAITLGYEPQWLLIKRTDSTSDWAMFNNMMGMTLTDDTYLWANLASVENTYNVLAPTATGFVFQDPYLNASGGTYIYIAIRRGPMKTPTTGTSVYENVAYTGNGTANRQIGTSVLMDAMLLDNRDATAQSWSTYGQMFFDRLRGDNVLLATASTSAESTGWQTYFDSDMNVGWDTGTTTSQDYLNKSGATFVSHIFRRAPGFFDVVCYTGTGGTGSRSLTHNLGAAPEFIILKRRDSTGNWATGSMFTSTTVTRALLNRNDDQDLNSLYSGQSIWGGQPTSSAFLVDASGAYNTSAATYVAYLFATVAGVSKVGTYTGTGALQTVNCGFTGGARFVLIRRANATGDWFVYDSARGISSGNDPYLLLNSTAAEVTGTNYVDTTSVGFQVTAAAPAGLNANGGSYIFLAIA